MQLKVLDLFAGCGGLSLGLEMAGLEVVAACEVDQWASDTYRENHKNTQLIQADISKLPDGFWRSEFKGKIDVVAGGPPCQGFSVSGKRQYGVISETNSLVTNFLKVVGETDPDYVIVENVKGFRTGSISKNKKVFDYLVETLGLLGYHVYHDTLNAEQFGVPSLRARLFVVASKERFSISPFKRPTHSTFNGNGFSPLVTVADAIADLPPIAASEGQEFGQRYYTEAQNYYQKIMRQGSLAVNNHVAMKHAQRLIEGFKGLEQGHSSYRIGRQTGEEKVTSYKMNNQRLFSDKPSLCITANFQSTFVHPTLPRNLTAREAARLMSFPDTYLFKGKRTQMSSTFLKKYGREHEDYLSQYNQIGNAVPPLLGKAVGEGLRTAIVTDRTNSSEFLGKEQLCLSI